ncbi:MAG: hypothetical protein GY862_31535 [Gammaproteobacteria bacterium]|nr:hypothetical protein [Gammaproteobacteria bacterium]
MRQCKRKGYASVRDIREEGKAEGELNTLKEMLIQVLSARGLAADDAFRTITDACNDPERLKHWLRQAVNATSLSELS